MNNSHIEAVIFDLDGVLVDTVKFHFQAWSRIALDLGVHEFTESHNEQLKGASRMHSLEFILEIGGLELQEEEKYALTQKKNDWYREYITELTSEHVLPGVVPLMKELKEKGYRIGLGSASRNARLILKQIGLEPYLEGIVDGTDTVNSKPDPEVFLKCAEKLGIEPQFCLVMEDAQKGIEAAINGGFRTMGIGDRVVLNKAEFVVPSLKGISLEYLEEAYGSVFKT